MEEDAIFRLSEGVAKQQGEEDAEECRSEDATLFNTARNWEEVRIWSVVLNITVNVIVEGRDQLQELGGHPIFCRRVERPVRPTKSNALVRSMKAMNKGRLCSRHFSCNCLREKTMSIVDLAALTLHCASG